MPKTILHRGRRLPVADKPLNSDPLGRKFNNVGMEHFGTKPARSRGVSLSGLRPSFFAMLKRDATPTPTGE